MVLLPCSIGISCAANKARFAIHLSPQFISDKYTNAQIAFWHSAVEKINKSTTK